jgi:peroxiredoxin Q/BCP
MHNVIQIGQPIPSFAISDAKGNEITSKKLHGTYYVLYFYPQNDTPGCTIEACSFRDNKPAFDELNIPVFGISPDNQESHLQFEAKHKLNFILIPDPTHLLCDLFGVMVEKESGGKTHKGIERTTFIIDDKGILQWMEKPVKVEGHIQRVLQELKKLVKQQPA